MRVRDLDTKGNTPVSYTHLLLREFKVEANVGAPQVAYRETIRKEANQETKLSLIHICQRDRGSRYHPSENPQPADLPCKDRRLRTLLRFRYGQRRAGPSGRVIPTAEH